MRTAFIVLTAFVWPGGIASAQYTSRVFDGAVQGEQFGSTTCFIGDVDADGRGDFLVGMPAADGVVPDEGRAQIFSGATGLPIWQLAGVFPSQSLGLRCAEAGDVDGDGHSDFYLWTGGIEPVTAQPAHITLYSGATGLPLRLYPWTSPQWYTVGLDEHSIGTVGDIDGDGVVDSVMGAPLGEAAPGFSPGVAHVVSGASGAVLATLAGVDPLGQFGSAVAGLGDVTGDGVPDFAVSAFFDSRFGSNAGSVTIFNGATRALVRVLPGTAPIELFGDSIAALGDVDADGRGDLAVGGYKGRVHIVSGASGVEIRTIVGAIATQFGRTVVSVADQDGDGKGDLLVCEPLASVMGVGSGSVHLCSGATGAVLRTFRGDGPLDRFGAAISGGGDVNGDGIADFVIASPNAHKNSGYGSVRLFESACQSLYSYGYGCAGTGGFTPKLEFTGCVPAGGAGSLTLTVSNAHGGGVALLFAGVVPLYYNQGGGCPVLAVPLVAPIVALPLSGGGPGAGATSVTFPVSASQLPIDALLQVFATDPMPRGYSASNGFVVGVPGT